MWIYLYIRLWASLESFKIFVRRKQIRKIGVPKDFYENICEMLRERRFGTRYQI